MLKQLINDEYDSFSIIPSSTRKNYEYKLEHLIELTNQLTAFLFDEIIITKPNVFLGNEYGKEFNRMYLFTLVNMYLNRLNDEQCINFVSTLNNKSFSALTYLLN
jgi:hypothetical protein